MILPFFMLLLFLIRYCIDNQFTQLLSFHWTCYRLHYIALDCLQLHLNCDQTNWFVWEQQILTLESARLVITAEYPLLLEGRYTNFLSFFIEVLHTIKKKDSPRQMSVGCVFSTPLVSVPTSFMKSIIRVALLEWPSLLQ